MSAPIPPANQPVDPLVQLGHTIRDRADIILARHRAVILLLVCAFVFAGWRAYVWHVERLARLEAQASVEKTRATNEHALAAKWKSRAIALTDSVRVDTIRVDSIVYRTRAFTAPVTVAAPDGTTSVVPMTVVAKADFDSLGAACTRVQHDCASALAAKDSVIAHQDSARVALAALNANVSKRLGMAKRGAVLSKILWGLAGLVIGRASAIK